MTTTDLLARIDKLGPEWKYPMEAGSYKGYFVDSQDEPDGFYINDRIALDLHLRHIAEKLNWLGIYTVPVGSKQWSSNKFWGPGESYDKLFTTWAEALVSAAEAVGGC